MLALRPAKGYLRGFVVIIQDLGGLDNITALKKKILRWVKKHTDPYDDLDVNNLTSDFADGKPFLAILNNVNPSGSPYNPSNDPLDNVKRALKDANEKYGVPILIDPDDPNFWKDEKAMIPQLAELMKRLPDEVADKDTIADQGQDGWFDQNFPKVKDNLADLVAIPSIPVDPEHVKDMENAAEKVADIMKDNGLDNVVVDKDGDIPFVMGHKITDPEKPTVLLYANYGVSQPDDPAGGSWNGDPFQPVVDDSSIAGKGVAEDKAHVVAPIAAVKAIMDTMGPNALPVNVKVVVGGVPPPTSSVYDPSLNTQNLKGFIDRHRDALMPDYILVSEPDGSRLAPGAAAGMFSCRGFVSFDVSASTFDPATPEEPFCARWVGPCLDPAIPLAKAVGKLRTANGAIAVSGMEFPVDPVLRDAIQGISYEEADLRKDSGYLPHVTAAPKEGVSLVEQLCFFPGVSVVGLSGIFSPQEESTVPRVATCRVHANIAPSQPVEDAYEKLKQHITKEVGFGINLEFGNMRGEPGWHSDPLHQFFQSTCSSMAAQFQPRPAASSGNPEYKPIPATFANAFGKPTYMHGVNDATRNVGHANENVVLEDVKREIKAFVKTLTGLSGLPLGPSAVAIKVPLSTDVGAEEKTDPATPVEASTKTAADLEAEAALKAQVADAPSAEILAVLTEINSVRANPGEYAKKLESLRGCFNAQNVYTPEDPSQTPAATHEGWAAVDECVSELKAMSSSHPLERKKGMENAANDHANYLGADGRTGHAGPANDRAADRIAKYGIWFDLAGEVIAYRETEPEAIVRQMLVCDGEKTRSDRKALLNADMSVCGIAIVDHTTLEKVVVVTVSAGFGPFPLLEPHVVTHTGAPVNDPMFLRVLQSIPVAAVQRELNGALEAGSTVTIEFNVNKAIFTILTSNGTQEKKAIEWGN